MALKKIRPSRIRKCSTQERDTALSALAQSWEAQLDITEARLDILEARLDIKEAEVAKLSSGKGSQSPDFQVKLSIVKNIRQMDDLIAKLDIYPAGKLVMP